MQRNLELEKLRDRLLRAFPPKCFTGVVSSHDECEEGIALRRELLGKSWEQISSHFVLENSLSLALLEPDALVAILPAWLLRSAENFDGASLLLEFTVYFLSPGSQEQGRDEARISKTVGLFDADQRTLVGDFLRTILDNPELRGCHQYALQGLKWWRA